MIPDKGAVFLNGKERKAGEMLSDTGFIIEKPACLKRESGYKNLKASVHDKSTDRIRNTYLIL